MTWKSSYGLKIILLCLLTPSLSWAGVPPGSIRLQDRIQSIGIRYESTEKFPSLQKKVGLTVGLGPIKDTKHGRLYVGHYLYGRVSNHLRGEPFPLEDAIRDSIVHLLSLQGIKTAPMSSWDGKEESLKDLGADSVMAIDIKRFWAEGTLVGRRTIVSTSIYLVIRLGVKKERRIFARDMYTLKKDSTVRLTPQVAEQTINETLAELLNAFFSDPY
jgi:hypothetical protein